MSTEDPSPQARAPARVLVIDDEEVVHRSLARLLSRRGHVTEAVFDAQEALNRLEAGGYDLVITDLMMPDMDGLELLEALAARSISVPVVMITGYPTIRTAVQALRLGAVDYVAKPFTQRELMAPVNRALRRAAESTAGDDEQASSGDGFEAPSTELSPGDRLCLPQHSWLVYQQDGTVKIGVEAAFLSQVGKVAAVRVPEPDESMEQGHVGFWLSGAGGEEHGVYMPLSGVVVEVNREVEPSRLLATTWLVRLLPDNLEGEWRSLAVPTR